MPGSGELSFLPQTSRWQFLVLATCFDAIDMVFLETLHGFVSSGSTLISVWALLAFLEVVLAKCSGATDVARLSSIANIDAISEQGDCIYE